MLWCCGVVFVLVWVGCVCCVSVVVVCVVWFVVDCDVVCYGVLCGAVM